MLLISLALVTAALLILGVFDTRMSSPAAAGLCIVGAGLTLVALAGAAPPTLLWLPVGLPGAGMTLALDGLAGWFLLIVFGAGAAASMAPPRKILLPPLIGAMSLTVLAGDGFSLLLGFELMSLVSWLLVLTHGDAVRVRDAALLHVGMATLAAVCLIAAVALLIPHHAGIVDLGFSAIRAAPPDGFRAAIAVVLLLVGVGATAGLVPLHAWLPPVHAAAPAPVAALMSGAMTKVALYVIIRVLFDLAGSAPPLWWGMALVTLGAASAVLGALRATQETELGTILACSTIGQVGLVAIGLGVALAARAADVTPLAALALAAALLHALAHSLVKSLLFLAAGAVEHGAGTRLLSRLGGLIATMKVTTACVLVGAAALAALPPGPGFAGAWLLFQSVLAAPRLGGLVAQTGFALAAAAMALAVGLAATAAVRLVGVAFLGRPRTPRGAAAVETAPATQTAMIALAVIAVLVGALPGPVLSLAEPALHQLLSATLADRTGLLAVGAQTDGPSYRALPLALLLAAVALAASLVLRRFAPAGLRRGPAWAGGFAAAPAWLPFGDPLTQYGGASFSQILRRTLAGAVLASREDVRLPAPGDTGPARLDSTARDPSEAWLFAPAARLRIALSGLGERARPITVRGHLAAMFAALVALLAAVAILGAR